MVAKGFRIEGRVQGVGFRWWTHRLGTRLGLAGWVANRGDGSVEVQVVGADEVLVELEQQLSAGPPTARVERVVPIPADGSVKADEPFRIERRP